MWAWVPRVRWMTLACKPVIRAVMKTITAEPTAMPKVISSVCMRLSSRKRRAIFHSVHSESARRMRSVLAAAGDGLYARPHALAFFGVADQHQIAGRQPLADLAGRRAQHSQSHTDALDHAIAHP